MLATKCNVDSGERIDPQRQASPIFVFPENDKIKCKFLRRVYKTEIKQCRKIKEYAIK